MEREGTEEDCRGEDPTLAGSMGGREDWKSFLQDKLLEISVGVPYGMGMGMDVPERSSYQEEGIKDWESLKTANLFIMSGY